MKLRFATLLIVILIFLVGCNNQDSIEYSYIKKDEDINGYEVYLVSIQSVPDDYAFCKMFSELEIQETESTYRYFYEDCLGTGYHILVDGEYFFFSTAINQGYITEQDILNTSYGTVREYPDETDPIDACDKIIAEDENPVAELHGYTIKRTEVTCEMVVGDIYVDGYYFGFISSGCSFDLDAIGYFAEKDGVIYSIQTLVDDEVFTVEELYNIYSCDEGKVGQYN